VIEIVSLRLEMEELLVLDDARQLRGFFGHEYKNRPEFHHHLPTGLLYQHPLIQYKILDGAGWITGLKEGAFLLLSMNPPEEVYIRNKHIRVINYRFIRNKTTFGITEEPIRYQFGTPWLPFNSENHRQFERIQRDQDKVNELLGKILIGNLLSLSKAVKYVVSRRLQASIHLELARVFTLKPPDDRPFGANTQKPGLKMLGFEGEFEVNFALPNLWDIGKSAARGFGAVQKKE
jgi:hypothetical protein